MEDLIFEEVKKNQSQNYLWVEKYRPQTFDEYIGNQTVKDSIKIFLEKGDIPHLLFYGPPGTGKTSLAKLLVKQVKCDYIYINASDENNVDTVRNKMKNFASSVGFKPLKIIILDESDRLTPEAQSALRNMMETFSLTTRFILTCNYVERIIPPLQSRCQGFEIKSLSKKEIAVHLAQILQKESVSFDADDIKFIVESYHPDIRKIINFSQQSNINNKLKIAKENVLEADFNNKLIELLKQAGKPNLFTEIRQLIVDSEVSSFEESYKFLYEKTDEYAKGKEAQVILELAESVYQSSLVFEKEITFVACISKLLKILK